MITVETLPVRMSALQWHKPGDGQELGVVSYRYGDHDRYGLHALGGMQRVNPGDWIVLTPQGKTQVLTNTAFHQQFKIIEEGQGNE